MSVREYRWEWELDNAAETPVRVVAAVGGRDERWSPQAVSPPERREVEIEARRYFCPSADDRDGCTGCEYEDVTAKASEEWLARMWDMALERDDEHAAEIAAAEREDCRRYMMGELWANEWWSASWPVCRAPSSRRAREWRADFTAWRGPRMERCGSRGLASRRGSSCQRCRRESNRETPMCPSEHDKLAEARERLTHAERVQEAERAVVERAVAVHAKLLWQPGTNARDEPNAAEDEIDSMLDAVDALLSLRAATCATCGGYGTKCALTADEESRGEWDDENGCVVVPCPAGCERGRKVGA